MAALLAVALWTLRLWGDLNRRRLLVHHGGPDDTLNHWSFENEHTDIVEGELITDGYRSAALQVLVIRDRNTLKLRRIAIWRDSVSAAQFSYLNSQLMFNTGDPHGDQ